LVVEAEKQEDGIAFRGRSYRLNEWVYVSIVIEDNM
jgi:hypothetical protein